MCHDMGNKLTVPYHGFLYQNPCDMISDSSLTEIVPLPVPGSCYGGSSSCYGEGNLGVLYFLLCFPKWPTWATLWTLLPLGGHVFPKSFTHIMSFQRHDVTYVMSNLDHQAAQV